MFKMFYRIGTKKRTIIVEAENHYEAILQFLKKIKNPNAILYKWKQEV